MTAVGIVGAGRAATLHAEAVRAARGVELAGLSCLSPESPRAADLAGAVGCPVLALPDLADRCEAVVVATPPAGRASIVAEMASSRAVRAVLVESPAATTLDGIGAVRAAISDRPVMAAANLLHAPAVRRMLAALAAMDPHHLELRLAVPDPARGPAGGRSHGGGVTVDPAAGFWPVLLAAIGTPIESVAVPRFDATDGLDRAAQVMLRSVGGRRALAELRWGAKVAEASVEAADSDRVARVDIWPAPVAEIDGVAVASLPVTSHPLAALGFTAQIERLVRVADGDAPPWPDLAVASSALTIAAAAALSIRRGGVPVNTSDVPRDLSPFEILSAP